jgi:hypothetical protein
MASFTVNGGVTDTAPKTVSNDDTGTIASGGTLQAATPITWTGGSASPGVVITNAGAITATTRGIDTSGAFTTGSITLHNNTGGRLISRNNDGFRINTNITTGTITVDNTGILVSGVVDGSNNVINDATSGQAIDFAALTSATVVVHITNNAGGLIGASAADAIRPGSNATIDNRGRIVTAGTGSDGIDFQTNTNGIVNNFSDGTITASRHGITGDNPFTLHNQGTITGLLGGGINMDTAAATTTVIDNSGTITGNGNDAVDGDGVDVDGLVNLDNHGTIQVFGSSTVNRLEAITIGGGIVNNFAGATIHGIHRAINVDDSSDGNAFAATTIYNEGLIASDSGVAIVIVDTFADTITNKGTITGSVAAGGGNDSFNLYTGSSISGTIDGGSGTDAVNLQGTGTGNVANLTQVEIVNLIDGTWTLGSEGFDSVNFVGGAETLHLAASTLADNHFSGTITGFGSGDAIDLQGIGVGKEAALGPGNLLTITLQSGGPITLQLDPAANYSGQAFTLSPDGAGGTILTVGVLPPPPPPPSGPTAGNDNVVGSDGADTIAALAGDDSVAGLGGANLLFGNQGNDTLQGGVAQDTVYGGVGNDAIGGQEGGDLLLGNEGQDTIDGGDGANTIVGGQDSADGADSIAAGSGSDLIWGNGGADTISADGGANSVIGGFGSDSIATGAGNDLIFGNQDSDSINAGDGANLVFGGLGADAVVTGAGNDTIWGNEGNDTLTGGAGADLYAFAAGSGGDQVNGFNFAEGDRLNVQGQTFTLGTSGDGDVLFTLSGGGTIELNGISPAAFSPGFIA